MRRTIVAAVLALLAAVAVVPATSAPSQAATTGFRDVTNHYQFYREISWLTEKGITTGYAGNWFRPEWEVSREAFAAFLYRLAGRPGVSMSSRSPFKDVPKSHQFYKEIVWLDKQGITTGWSDGTFRPDQAIDRNAMAAFLYRYEGKPSFSPPSRSPFKDLNRSSKFYKEITWLRTTGITTGFADGTFRPYASTSRAATAAFLFRGFGSGSYKAPTYVAPRTPFKASEVLSVARSQVGYKEPSFRKNKYNDWIGGSSAWCQVYVGWVFEKAGYPGYVPREAYYDQDFNPPAGRSTFVGRLQSAGVLDWNVSLSDLDPGDVVLINWGTGQGVSHAAIVDRVSGNGAWFYEGNTTSGTGSSARGVFHRWRSLSVVDAVFTPQAYYDATH
ncbi:S-layer homology domain-containing protein [Demequina sp. NBRC 110056]|uniref:S-layer homology domain-containing protein n=1 Tax=Demequina sp. NBRC 110056 TaxID=1570345 RepID=UPI001F2CF4C7|nr:S-layer homology domain-containing protein [Demequina sp. NBRC 110056]